jgi:hypothetical protein
MTLTHRVVAPSLFTLFALSSGFVASGCTGEAMDEDAIPTDESVDEAELGGDKADGPGIGYRAVLRYAHDAGLPCNSRAVVATAIARAESTFNPRASNGGSGWWVYGLWQIHSVHGYSQSELANPATNARAMMRVSGNGSNWTPWEVYTEGTYRTYLGAAWAARNRYNCE